MKKAGKKQGGPKKDGRWGLAPGRVQDKQRFDCSSVSTVAATYAAASTAVASDEYLQMKKEEKIKASK